MERENSAKPASCAGLAEFSSRVKDFGEICLNIPFNGVPGR